MRYLLAALSLFMLILPAAAQENASDQPIIKSHHIKVSLMPEKKSLEGSDSVTLAEAADGGFRFTLHKNLEVASIKSGGADVAFTYAPYGGDGAGEMGEIETIRWVEARLPHGATQFEVTYYGEIFDEINRSKALGRVRGDYTSGLISEDGVYLSPESGWYPDDYGVAALFTIEASVPSPWYSVTVGNLVSRKTTGGRRVSVWSCDHPLDGGILVANKYALRSRTIDGVKCSTYFYKDDADLSTTFFDRLEEYLPAYVELFGEYPYERFDIVENFFTTGYGMAGYTLLGSRVVRMPFSTLEGSLAHELVHNWWGNGVFVDWERGNWCEGLTYFSTNYYWKILSGDEESAKAHRLRDMQRYAIEVPEDEAYPIRKFRTKRTAVDGHIGYGKASAVFGMLHDMLGKEKFFDSLKLFYKQRRGKISGWVHIQAAFEEVSGKDLSGFFNTWLDNPDAPALKLRKVNHTKEIGAYGVHGALCQEGDMFHAEVPVIVTTEDGPSTLSIPLDKAENKFDFTLDEQPEQIEVDPEYTVFRRLPRGDVPSCLNGTLSADSILIVIPSGGADEMVTVTDYSMGRPQQIEKSLKQHYADIAQDILDTADGVRVMLDADVSDADLEMGGVLCFGSTRINSVTQQIATRAGTNIRVDDSSFSVDGQLCEMPGQAAMISLKNPYNREEDVTFYLGNSAQATFKASLIFHYGWDSWILWEDGKAVQRGDWEQGTGGLTRKLG